jgi:DNA-directed RNA polymerase subunit RPC12/RpoP
MVGRAREQDPKRDAPSVEDQATPLPEPTAPLADPGLQVSASRVRCPYCHDACDEQTSQEWVACASCLARHHEGCWAEEAACATCGHTRHLVKPEDRVRVVERVDEPDDLRGAAGWLALLLVVLVGAGAGIGYWIAGGVGAGIGAVVGLVLVVKLVAFLVV